MNKAEELIACLEGEIAKRDAELCERTEEVEYALADLNNALSELSAIKAQEPVAARVRFRHPQKTMPDWSVWQQTKVKPNAPAWTIDGAGYEVEYQPLYAAPVSEAKAQGVYSTDPLACSGCASGCFRCRDGAKAQGVVMPERETELFNAAYGAAVESGWESVKCMARQIWDAARLNAAPAQQVSVPDGWKLAPVEPTHEMLGAALMNQVECLDAIEVIRTDYKAMLAAAPAPGGE